MKISYIVNILFILILLFIILYKFNINKYKVLNDQELILPTVPSPALPEVNQSKFIIKKIDNMKYRFYNPSLVNVNNNLIYSFRLSNYTLCSNEKASDINLKNVNSLIYIKFNENLCLMDINTIKNKNYPNGFEDARLFIYNNFLYCIASKFIDDNKYIVRLALIKIVNLENIDMLNNNTIVPVEWTILLPTLNSELTLRDIEKNWMPIIDNDKLYFVYSYSPYILLKLNEKNTVDVVYKENNKFNKNIRGGTKTINYKDYLVCICHIRYKYYYTNVFCFFDNKYPFRLKIVSKEFIINENELIFTNFNPFKYLKSNIQFISGLEIYNNNLHITYGKNDCESRECIIDLKILDKIIDLNSAYH